RPTTDAVHALGETAVAPHAAARLVDAAVAAAGAVGRPAVTAPRVGVHRHVLLAEGGLRGPGPARPGEARIRGRPEQRVAGAGVPIVAAGGERDAEATGRVRRVADRDHRAVIVGGALVPVVAGGVVQRAGLALPGPVAGVGHRRRSGAEVVVVAGCSERGV